MAHFERTVYFRASPKFPRVRRLPVSARGRWPLRKAPRDLLVQRRPRRSPRWSSFPALSWARQSERRLASSSRAPCPAADDVVADERAAVAARDGAAVAVALEDASARLLPFSGEVERIGPLDQRRDRLLRGANAGLQAFALAYSAFPIGRDLLPRRTHGVHRSRPDRTFVTAKQGADSEGTAAGH